ncbi:hypothetical protein Poly59_35280 [Rubripirellula reticaptiva]|uniref:Uncharacterized protein n=1 Tax=Rubripirellula reticaptiva TaxID=2528013 RepID=A0A5C6ESD7_9BACT|nr:hypothetical protein Poly59_35280 [Rubripirellula reticaptiva]
MGSEIYSLSRWDSLTWPFFDLELGVSGAANTHGKNSRGTTGLRSGDAGISFDSRDLHSIGTVGKHENFKLGRLK